MHAEIEKLKFVSEFDGTDQECLFRGSWKFPARGIVVYLHGATNHMQQGFNREIFNGIFAKIQDFLYAENFVYACPEYRGDSWMNPAAEHDTRQLTGLLKKEFKTERVYIMGGSMGGTSSLIFASRNPDSINGVLALCPATDMEKLYYEWINGNQNQKQLAYGIEIAYGGNPEQSRKEYMERSSIRHMKALKNIPIAIIHGDSDKLISVEHSRYFVRNAVKEKISIFYHEIENGDHDSPVKDFHPVEKAMNFLFTQVR